MSGDSPGGANDENPATDIQEYKQKQIEIIKIQILAVAGAVTVPLLSIIILEIVSYLGISPVMTLPIEIGGEQAKVTGSTIGQAVALALIFERLLRLMLFGYPTIDEEYQPFGWFHDK
jgi:hypothetical protein